MIMTSQAVKELKDYLRKDAVTKSINRNRKRRSNNGKIKEL